MQASDYKNIYIYYILQYVRTSHNLKRAFVGGIGSAQEDLNELKAYRKYLNRIDSYCYDFYDFCLMSELSDQTNPEDGKIYLEEEGTRCNNSKSFKYKYIFKDLDGNKKEGELTIDKETFTKQILDDEKPRIFQKISDRSDLTPKIYHYRALCKISPYELEPSTNKAFNKYSALAREDDALFEKIQAIVGAITLFNKNNHKMDVLPSVLPESLDPLLQFINSNNIEEYKRWSSLFLNQQQILNFHMLFCDRAIETNRIDILQELFFLESFDINCVIPKLKMTPLELMIEQGKTEVVKQLLKRKALDVNFNNPLLKAVSEEQTDIVILLLSHPNVDVNASNEISGANPLWLAAKHGFLEIVQELLDHPAISVNYQCGKLSNRELKFLEFINKKKMSVQEVAECYDRQDIVDLLQSHKKTASIKRAESRQSNMSNQATHSSLNSNHQNNSPQVHFMFRGAQSQQKGFNPSNPEERIINVEISHDNNIGTSTTQPKSKVSL